MENKGRVGITSVLLLNNAFVDSTLCIILLAGCVLAMLAAQGHEEWDFFYECDIA